MPRYTEKAEQLTLPVIPLHDAVAFPSVPIDFESNDTAAVAAGEAAPQFGQTVLLVYIKDDNGETPAPEKLATVGTVARIRQSIKNREAGKVRFICECRSRATVSEYHKKGRLITASAMVKEIRLEDGTLAGSGITLFEGLKRCVKDFGVPEEEAILAATYNPAASVGLEGRCGSIAVGLDADFVVIDDDYKLLAVHIA